MLFRALDDDGYEVVLDVPRSAAGVLLQLDPGWQRLIDCSGHRWLVRATGQELPEIVRDERLAAPD